MKIITFSVILEEFDITFWSYLLPSSSQIHTLLSIPLLCVPLLFKNRLDNSKCLRPLVFHSLPRSSPEILSSLGGRGERDATGRCHGLIGVAHPMWNWSLHCDQWQLREAASICCEHKSLWWGMTAPLICGQKERNSECSWFYRCRNADASPPGSTSLAALRKWLRLQCQAWMSSQWVARTDWGV